MVHYRADWLVLDDDLDSILRAGHDCRAHMTLLQPRLFISYARENQELARRIRASLIAARCHVFMDEEQILIGEAFAARLRQELARCEGLVFLHTRESADSEWCKAEVYAAGALDIQLLRVRVKDASALPDPLERLLSGVHYLESDGTNVPPVDKDLGRARALKRNRWLRRSAGLVGIFGSMAALLALFFSGWDEWQTERQRVASLNSIESSTSAWSSQQIANQFDDLKGDTRLLGRLRTLVDDPKMSSMPRFNAWQVAQYAAHAQERGERWDLTGLHWQNTSLAGAVLSDATLREGRIEKVALENCILSGIYLGGGPNEKSRGFSLVDARFTGCQFWNTWFDKTQLISVEFKDSTFRGVQMSLNGMGAVRFVSSPAEGVVITPNLTLFEDSHIVGLDHGPEAGVLDLSTPEHEVIFEGVEFVRVTFEGWFRPEWFRNSHFTDCRLPASLSTAQLSLNNRVDAAP